MYLPAYTNSESCASTDYVWIFRTTFSASYCVSEFCTEFSIAEVSTQVATQVATQVSTQLSITCADILSWGLQQGSIWNWNWSEVHFRPWMQWSGRRGAFRTSKLSPTTNYFLPNFSSVLDFTKITKCIWAPARCKREERKVLGILQHVLNGFVQRQWQFSTFCLRSFA